MIRFESVSKTYDGQRRAALDNVNVDIDNTVIATYYDGGGAIPKMLKFARLLDKLCLDRGIRQVRRGCDSETLLQDCVGDEEVVVRRAIEALDLRPADIVFV